MTRTMLSGLAAFAALTLIVSAASSADAQQLRQHGGAHLNNSGGNANAGSGGARPGQRGPRKLSNGQQQPAANTGASLHALGVYLQWREKCLDNLLPKCK